MLIAILIIICIICILITFYTVKNTKKLDAETQEKNKKLQEEYKHKLELNELLDNKYQELDLSCKLLENSCIEKEKAIQILNQSIENTKKMSEKALSEYSINLDSKYKKIEEEFNSLTSTMKEAYANKQMNLMEETAKVQDELDKIKATRTAAIEASLREKEIEDNVSFYCIDISDIDKADIAKLETIKVSLNKPRVLSMLIWQTWFQKPLKALSANVIGVNDKTGIYKITNIKTKECYIGQAVAVKDRWTDHVKCGLGIDTPANNKFYKAMQDYGVWNFSFELLEECSRDLLNEKEKYYIDLYNSYEYGYNSTRGNK